jgi:5-methylcytosine-specific restriction endonuclease McrA
MDSKFKRGKLNPGWKGKNRYNGIWMINRLKVLKRDDHKCRWCLSSKKLEVHHIFPVVIYNMYNVCKAHKLINLITLCKKHHNLIHGK